MRFLLDLVIFGCNCFEVARHPLGRVDLRFAGNGEKIRLLFVPKLTQIIFGFENLFQIAIFNCLLLDINVHLAEPGELLLELLSERVLLAILCLELPESLVRLLERLRNITILLLTHANGLILLGQ